MGVKSIASYPILRVSASNVCVCVEKKRKILVVDICLSRLESKQKGETRRERERERALDDAFRLFAYKPNTVSQ
jgi:translation initiation factor 2 alpha subunit (eIF-2alpha)